MFHSNVNCDPYILHAYVDITQDTINYMKKGGLPLVIGEWALAGAQMLRLKRTFANQQPSGQGSVMLATDEQQIQARSERASGAVGSRPGCGAALYPPLCSMNTMINDGASDANRSRRAGPAYPYDYNANGYTWVGSYQTANVSAWYNAQKHAHCYPGTTADGGSGGWFQWNIRDHSGAHQAV